MNQGLHHTVLNRLSGLFDNDLIQNNLRGLYVETMVAELLGEGWKLAGYDWAAWDIVHDDGTRLEVKQSAAKQTWASPANSKGSASFSIKKPKQMLHGAEVTNVTERLANIYVFGWHGVTTEDANQRDADQWSFFVLPTSALPDQGSIGLNPLRKLAMPVSADALRASVEQIRLQGDLT